MFDTVPGYERIEDDVAREAVKGLHGLVEDLRRKVFDMECYLRDNSPEPYTPSWQPDEDDDTAEMPVAVVK